MLLMKLLLNHNTCVSYTLTGYRYFHSDVKNWPLLYLTKKVMKNIVFQVF